LLGKDPELRSVIQDLGRGRKPLERLHSSSNSSTGIHGAMEIKFRSRGALRGKEPKTEMSERGSSSCRCLGKRNQLGRKRRARGSPSRARRKARSRNSFKRNSSTTAKKKECGRLLGSSLVIARSGGGSSERKPGEA